VKSSFLSKKLGLTSGPTSVDTIQMSLSNVSSKARQPVLERLEPDEAKTCWIVHMHIHTTSKPVMLKCLKALLLRLHGLRGLHREVREAYGQVGRQAGCLD
jgi:hypothetical protein